MIALQDLLSHALCLQVERAKAEAAAAESRVKELQAKLAALHAEKPIQEMTVWLCFTHVYGKWEAWMSLNWLPCKSLFSPSMLQLLVGGRVLARQAGVEGEDRCEAQEL
jgi:hypothetical protein